MPSILEGISAKTQLEVLASMSKDSWGDKDIEKVFASDGWYKDWVKKLKSAGICTPQQCQKAIAYVADQLKLDLETWEARLEKIVELHSTIIQRRRNQIAQIKRYLLKLHASGVLSEQVAGVERRIDFQNNPPSVVLLVEPNELPTEFQDVKVSAKSKDILAAYKRGEDVSAIAEIVTLKHVRFRHMKQSKSQRS